MARTFTTEQRALLRAPELKVRLLTTWWMDAGEYRFCDDVQDIMWDGETYIGANALAAATDVKSASNGWAAESVTVTIDGTRLSQAGMSDPAAFFQTILALPLANRRVDISVGLMTPADENPVMVIPIYAGKINNPKLIDPAKTFGAADGSTTQTKLEITLDSLAARYQWITGRTRSHEDQLEIDPTDMFFSFVQDNVRSESTLYWGKKAPEGISAGALNSQGGVNGFDYSNSF